jgi:hypothetical protein
MERFCLIRAVGPSEHFGTRIEVAQFEKDKHGTVVRGAAYVTNGFSCPFEAALQHAVTQWVTHAHIEISRVTISEAN